MVSLPVSSVMDFDEYTNSSWPDTRIWTRREPIPGGCSAASMPQSVHIRVSGQLLFVWLSVSASQSPGLIIPYCLFDLVAVVHHERPVLRHRFLQRFTRQQQQFGMTIGAQCQRRREWRSTFRNRLAYKVSLT